MFLPVSPSGAWAAILGVLAFSAVVLWYLRDEPRFQTPHKPTSYREAA